MELREPIPRSAESIYMENILWTLLTIAIILFAFTYIRGKKELFNHWSVLIQGLSYSTKDYYNKVREILGKQGIGDIQIGEHNIKSGGIGSKTRIYLQVRWNSFIYEICAAPFGNSFFVSYWAYEEPSRLNHSLSQIPLVGKWLAKTFVPVTMYRVDTRTMSHTLIHSCIVDVAEALAKEQKLPPLTEQQRSPIMSDLFKR